MVETLRETGGKTSPILSLLRLSEPAPGWSDPSPVSFPPPASFLLSMAASTSYVECRAPLYKSLHHPRVGVELMHLLEGTFSPQRKRLVSEPAGLCWGGSNLPMQICWHSFCSHKWQGCFEFLCFPFTRILWFTSSHLSHSTHMCCH